MKLIVLVAALLVGAAIPALAQTTNTNCYTSYGQTYCRSTVQPAPVQPDPNAFQRGYQDSWNRGQQMMDALERGHQLRLQREEQARAAAASAREMEVRQATGRMIAAGRCPEARELALTAGMLALAMEVQALCEAPQESPAQ